MHRTNVGSRARVAMVLGLLASMAMPLLAGAPAAAAEITTVVLSVEPGTELQTYTPATYRAVVTPSAAAGTVTFTADGISIGTAPVVGGQAVIETTDRPAGTVVLAVSFSPQPGSGYAAAVSNNVTVAVSAVPRVWLATIGGALVPPGSQLRAGQSVRIVLDGFPANTLVSFTVGTTPLPVAVVTGATGGAMVPIEVPDSLRSSVYLLAASGGKRSAAFVFYVYNPPAPTPASTSPGTAVAPVTATPPSPVVVASSGGVAVAVTSNGTVGVRRGLRSATSGASLPITGGNPVELVLTAALAFGVGSTLLVAGRRRPAGRHSVV